MRWTEVKKRFEDIDNRLNRLEKNLFDIEQHLVGFEKKPEEVPKVTKEDIKANDEYVKRFDKPEVIKNNTLLDASTGNNGGSEKSDVQAPAESINKNVTKTLDIKGHTIGEKVLPLNKDNKNKKNIEKSNGKSKKRDTEK